MKKFTLRDLFWLVLVVAILCGWWLDRGRQAKETRTLRVDMERLGRQAIDLEDHLIDAKQSKGSGLIDGGCERV